MGNVCSWEVLDGERPNAPILGRDWPLISLEIPAKDPICDPGRS